MAQRAIVVVDTSEVRPGKGDELRAAIADLAEFVAQREPRMLLYQAHLSADGARLTMVQAHPDAASLEAHLDLAGPRFAPFAGMLRMTGMQVYGDPGERALAVLRAKAARLGGIPVEVHPLHAGFARLGA